MPFGLSLRKFPRDVSDDDPVAALDGFTYHDYDEVLAAPHVSTPEPGAAEALAGPNLIRDFCFGSPQESPKLIPISGSDYDKILNYLASSLVSQ